MNQRTIVRILTGIVGAAIGGLIGIQFDRPILGVVAGLAAGVPCGFFATSGQRRWLAVAALNLQLVLAYYVGGLLGTVFTAIAAGLTFFIASAVLTELYGGSEWAALSTHLRLVLSLIQGFQIVDDSTPTGPQTGKPLFGPRLLIIRPGKAALLERGVQRRVVGPGLLTTTPFEYVKYVYHLGDQQIDFSFPDILTQDMVSTTVQLTALYRLNVAPGVGQGLVPLTPPEETRLLRIPLSMPAWETALRHVLLQSVRQATGRHQFDNLLDGSALANLEGTVLALARNRTANWGITIEQIILQGVLATPDVASAMEARRKERERALGMQEALTLLASGYNQARAAGMQEGDIRQEVLRRTLEEIVQQLTTRRVL